MRLERMLRAAIFCLGVGLVIVPWVVFPVCTGQLTLASGGEVPMKCHWMQRAVMSVGGITAVLGLALWLRRDATKPLDFAAPAACGVVEILLANVWIGACKGATMRCVMGTRPAVNLLAALLLLVSIGGIATDILAEKRRRVAS